MSEELGISAESLVIASSDDSADRVEIMTTCLERLGGVPDQAIYIGDGLWDLEASRMAGWAFIGVGEKLRGRCENWIADFTDVAWQLPAGSTLGMLPGTLKRMSSVTATDPVFEGAQPILRVRDLEASVDYYANVLGFKVDFHDLIASDSRGRCALFLVEGDQGNPGTWVCSGVGRPRANGLRGAVD